MLNELYFHNYVKIAFTEQEQLPSPVVNTMVVGNGAIEVAVQGITKGEPGQGRLHRIGSNRWMGFW
jgi:hypothetical protein